MKVKRILHGVLQVLGLSVIGLLFCYLMWLITDEEFRDMLKQGWPFTSGMILLDYAACCLLTTLITLYYWRSRADGPPI
jgi:TRAP-type C4-dicarboxylate transport system permease small subunit